MTSSYVNSSFQEPSIECTPEVNHFMMAFAVIPLSQVIINVFLIIAVMSNRNRIRHNFVYAYVINTSAANTLFGLFSLYDMVHSAFVFERNWGDAEPFKANNKPLLNWWSFRTGMIASSFIVMSGSISALIYGIRESSYFVGRTVRQRHIVKTPSKHKQRVKMLSIIFFNWCVPIGLCIASAAGWSCVQYCKCTPAYYGPDVFLCRTDVNKQCSTVLLPQANSFMLVTALTWLVECVGIVFMIVTTIKKYMDVMATTNLRPLSTISVACVSDPDANLQGHSVPISRLQSDTSKPNKDATLNDFTSCREEDNAVSHTGNATEKVHCQNKKDFADEDPSPRFSKLPPLNHNIKLLLIISILFILCTSPTMVIVLVDAFSDDYQLSLIGVVLPFLVCLIYGSIGPIVLVYYMSGLRTAVLYTLFRISCFKRTTLSSRNSKSTSG